MIKVFLAIVVLVVTGMSAKADTVGLTSGKAENLVLLDIDSVARLPVDAFTFHGSSSPTTSRTYGINFCSPRGLSGDTFVVTIANMHQNPLTFEIALKGIGSSVQNIISGNRFTFSMSVPWGGANNFTITVTSLGVIERGSFVVASVHEPASMLLLGSGLIGLGAAVRWQLKRTRVNKNAVGRA